MALYRAEFVRSTLHLKFPDEYRHNTLQEVTVQETSRRSEEETTKDPQEKNCSIG